MRSPEEVLEAVAHAESVLKYAARRLTPADVGIVTPYHKQVRARALVLRLRGRALSHTRVRLPPAAIGSQAVKLREQLGRRPALVGVTVGSVELFQGGERAVIIVSTVRSSANFLEFDARHALGFLTNPKRFNVAVTRAKQLLIVVGNPAILALDDSWSALLRYAVAHGAYRGVALPPGFDGGSGDGGDGAGGGGGGGTGGGGSLLQSLAADAHALGSGGAEDADADDDDDYEQPSGAAGNGD